MVNSGWNGHWALADAMGIGQWLMEWELGSGGWNGFWALADGKGISLMEIDFVFGKQINTP